MVVTFVIVLWVYHMDNKLFTIHFVSNSGNCASGKEVLIDDDEEITYPI